MISLVCNICGESIRLLPGPRQQETKFHQHKIIHKQCYDELMEFETYYSKPEPIAWIDLKKGRLYMDKTSYKELKEYLGIEG